MWPWLILAALVGIASALVLRRRGSARRVATAAATTEWEAAAPLPTPAPPAADNPGPAPAEDRPALPGGLVTTRLRATSPKATTADLPTGLVSTRRRTPAPEVESSIPAGAVVSTRLRPWVDIDLAITDVLLTATEAVLRFRLLLANGGSASARDLVIEALALNAGDGQDTEIATFYGRPAGPEVGVAELPRLGSTELTHQVRMPRSAIRAYEVQGRPVFVPILAFNVSYRGSTIEGRTSAAFLVGHQPPGADRLAPLGLEEGDRRLFSLGVRRLEIAARR